MVHAHSLQISLRHSLDIVLGHFLGLLKHTLSPYGFLVVKEGRFNIGSWLTCEKKGNHGIK